MKLSSEEITNIIDTVKQGVVDSWMGEFVVYGGTPEAPTKQINPLAYQLYLSTLSAVINRLEQIEEVVPPAPKSSLDISDFQDN